MKGILFTLCFLFGIQSVLLAQWEEKNVATISTLSAIAFRNETNGFVTGDNTIYKTTNGGDSWQACYTGAGSIFLEDIFLFDGNKAVAVGKDYSLGQSIILKSVDNGQSWTSIQIFNTNLLNSVFFVNANLGYIVGNSGLILKTTNGGNSWQGLNSGTGYDLQSIYFVNDQVGIAAGGAPGISVIAKTLDGGNTWNQISPPSTSYLQSVYFFDETAGFAVGWNGGILSTYDCGVSWIPQTSVDMSGNLEVVFTDTQTGYVVGGSVNQSLIQKTNYGGALWEDISPNLNEGLTSICFVNAQLGYAAGANGTVVKTETAGVVTSSDEADRMTPIQVFPNPASTRLSIDAGQTSGLKSIRWFDVNGNVLRSRTLVGQQAEVDCSDFPAGVYYLEIKTGDAVTVKKIIKV
ncbi:MAG: YCF48-related protein [Saprospiraceae bacterium]